MEGILEMVLSARKINGLMMRGGSMSLIPCTGCGRGIKEAAHCTDIRLCDECKSKSKLIMIELDSFNDVPVVYFKGKRITNIQDINFQWSTDTEEQGNKKIGISYLDINEKVIKGIKEIKL